MTEAKHGAFTWNELMTGDVEKAKAFYTETVGWSYDAMPMPEGTYWLAMQSGTPVAGIMDMTGVVPEGVPPHWMSYLAVDDIDTRIKKVEAAGGTVIREPFEIEKVGKIAILADATGAVMGWITPASQGA